MNKIVLKVFLVLIVGLTSNYNVKAQSKTELAAEVERQKMEIESLKPRLTSLEKMYDATKQRLGGDFNPEEFKAILDSAAEVGFQEDSVYARLKKQNLSLADSVNQANNQLDTLSEKLEHQEKMIDNCIVMLNLISDKPVTREEVEKGLDDNRKQVIRELKQLKELMDSGILTKEEFEEKKKIAMEKW